MLKKHITIPPNVNLCAGDGSRICSSSRHRNVNIFIKPSRTTTTADRHEPANSLSTKTQHTSSRYNVHRNVCTKTLRETCSTASSPPEYDVLADDDGMSTQSPGAIDDVYPAPLPAMLDLRLPGGRYRRRGGRKKRKRMERRTAR